VSTAPKSLVVEGLKASLGRQEVLHGVDLTIKPGELVVVVGPNGAGKTTLLKAAAGLLPAVGSIAVGGTPLSQLSPVERARRIA
jgi:iron complex transport system ATP-binding protein